MTRLKMALDRKIARTSERGGLHFWAAGVLLVFAFLRII